MTNYVVKTKNLIMLGIIKGLDDRSGGGIDKYNTILDDGDIDTFLQHLKEELMDAVNYIEKLQSKL